MEIVVVGAGVFGAWTALSLAQAGHKVTLIDRWGPGNERSSSAGESRIIRSAYGADDIYSAMAQRSLRLWTDFFEGEKRQDLFHRTGVLWMARAEERSLSDSRTVFERLAITHDWLDANAIERRYPQFQINPNTLALFEPEAGALLAEGAIRLAVAAASRLGVIYETAEVSPPVLEDAQLTTLQTNDGRRFSADHFVFACGSWLPKLFPALKKVIRPTRQDLFFFSVLDALDQLREGALPIWIDQTDLKIAYGFPDLGNGIKVGFHRLGPPFDPDQARHPASPESVAEAADYLSSHLPAMRGAAMRTTQVCHYENTPNGDLLIDLHPGTENVWLVGGGSGHGFKHAPAVAEYVTDAVSGASFREPRFSLAEKQVAAGGRVL